MVILIQNCSITILSGYSRILYVELAIVSFRPFFKPIPEYDAIQVRKDIITHRIKDEMKMSVFVQSQKNPYEGIPC